MNDSITDHKNKIYINENANQNILENYHNENENSYIDNKIPSTLLVCRTIQNQELLMPTRQRWIRHNDT